MAVTRIKNNQITDATITSAKIASQTLVGSLFATDLTLNSNVSIIGNLTITGNSSNINAINTFITDPFVIFNNGYTGSLANYTIGILVNRNLASLANYGSVNTAWVWDENDGAFAGLTTTDTGVGITTINNSGYANVKVGNLVATHSVTATNYNISQANVIDAKVTTLVATNFSTGNAVISGGYISALTNAYVTTSAITNLSTANAVISGGYISGLANITATTGNTQSWYTTTINATSSNITTGSTTNFSSGNVLISGGYISALSNATITTANIGNINFSDVTVSSTNGNLVLSPQLSNANAVVTIAATSALQLPAGTTTQQPTPVTGGAIRWNNSTNTLEVYNGSSWISLLGQINNQTITPDGISTVFTLDYSTTAEGIIVSINGTLQQPGVAYTVAGTQITFTEIPLVTDAISIRYIAAATVTAQNTQEINSGNVALTTTPVIIDSFDQSTYRSAKYMATTTAASSAEFSELAIVHMGSTVAVSNVNRVITGSTLTTFIANISGTTVRLWANTVTGTANIKIQKTYFVV
jgi:hypothetical protein